MPSSDTFIEKDSSINEHIEQMRLSATKALLERRDAIIVCTVSAIYGLGDPERIPQDGAAHGARRTHRPARADPPPDRDAVHAQRDATCTRGTYRVRGEVIDVHPAESDARRCASNCSTARSRR